MMHTNHRRSGSATIEMTLVGIPLIFTLISIMEIARGMWIYHTLAHAIREGTRYTIVHGLDCKISPNNCPVTVGQIATVIKNAAVGLDAAQMQVQMTDGVQWTTGSITLTSALANTTTFPTSGGDTLHSPITFTATYPFQSAIAMFWPGAGPGMNFMTVTFPASSTEQIQF